MTGDTLVSSHQAAKVAKRKYQKATENKNGQHKGYEESGNLDSSDTSGPVLAGLAVPEAVFFCSVEPPSMAYQKKLDDALYCLTREDPSLRVRCDEETGQIILSGKLKSIELQLHCELLYTYVHNYFFGVGSRYLYNFLIS